MEEGPLLFPSLIRPALLFVARFALALPAVERIAAGVTRSCILFLVNTMDEHNGGLCHSEAVLRGAINAGTAYAGLEGIRFSARAPSIFGAVLPNASPIGECVRNNSTTPTNLEEVFKPCAICL